jgi:hypothetical protein
MKVILFLMINSISVGTDAIHTDVFQRQFDDLEACVQASDRMKKILTANDNLQFRDTEVHAHCEVSKGKLSEQEYRQAQHKLRRLEKLYSTAKW